MDTLQLIPILLLVALGLYTLKLQRQLKTAESDPMSFQELQANIASLKQEVADLTTNAGLLTTERDNLLLRVNDLEEDAATYAIEVDALNMEITSLRAKVAELAQLIGPRSFGPASGEVEIR
jgi:chromosome segregation ATPase